MSLRWLLWSLLSPSQLILLSCSSARRCWPCAGRGSGRWLSIARRRRVAVSSGCCRPRIYLAHPLEARFPQPDLPAQITGIVLLCRCRATGRIGALRRAAARCRTAGRYITTLRLAARYPDARIVFSGGPRREPGKGPLETQTAVVAAILGSVGLDPHGSRSRSARPTPATTPPTPRRWCSPQPGETWVVVTSAMPHAAHDRLLPRRGVGRDRGAACRLPWVVPGSWNVGVVPDRGQPRAARRGPARMGGPRLLPPDRAGPGSRSRRPDLTLPARPPKLRALRWAVSSAVEHCFHTAGVDGSIPSPPTTFPDGPFRTHG